MRIGVDTHPRKVRVEARCHEGLHSGRQWHSRSEAVTNFRADVGFGRGVTMFCRWSHGRRRCRQDCCRTRVHRRRCAGHRRDACNRHAHHARGHLHRLAFGRVTGHRHLHRQSETPDRAGLHEGVLCRSCGGNGREPTGRARHGRATDSRDSSDGRRRCEAAHGRYPGSPGLPDASGGQRNTGKVAAGWRRVWGHHRALRQRGDAGSERSRSGGGRALRSSRCGGRAGVRVGVDAARRSPDFACPGLAAGCFPGTAPVAIAPSWFRQ